MEWTSTCHLTEFRPARASEPHTTTGKPKAHTSSERKSFPRDVHPPHDAYLPRDVPMGCKRFRHAKANLYGQVEAKPHAHARLTGHLTDHLARARTRTCLQAEEPPQLDEQQKASTAKGIPKIHGTSTSTIHSFGRRFRFHFLTFSFLTLADILVRYVSISAYTSTGSTR